jgi:hypothetical protein
LKWLVQLFLRYIVAQDFEQQPRRPFVPSKTFLASDGIRVYDFPQ